MASIKKDLQLCVLEGEELEPHDEKKGTHFQVFQCPEGGLWYWGLWLSHSPQGPAARSERSSGNQQIRRL
jgi:hypothetical protein